MKYSTKTIGITHLCTCSSVKACSYCKSPSSCQFIRRRNAEASTKCRSYHEQIKRPWVAAALVTRSARRWESLCGALSRSLGETCPVAFRLTTLSRSWFIARPRRWLAQRVITSRSIRCWESLWGALSRSLSVRWSRTHRVAQRRDACFTRYF